MPESGLITFTHRELVEILLKHQNVKRGLWALYVRFGLKASNVGTTEQDLMPSAIVPVLEIGLQKGEKENSLTVDAAKLARIKKPQGKKKK